MDILRQTMIELAPKVEELSGLRIPRKHGHMVHPRIRWITDIWHDRYYAFYRKARKIIYVNANYVAHFNNLDFSKATIAHEYTHYLQDIHWSRKKWDDIHALERMAFEIEMQFTPLEYRIGIEERLAEYNTKPDKFGNDLRSL